MLVDERGEPWNLDRLTKAVAKVRDHAGIVHLDPETGKERKKHLHDARGTFATKLMTVGGLGRNSAPAKRNCSRSPKPVRRR